MNKSIIHYRISLYELSSFSHYKHKTYKYNLYIQKLNNPIGALVFPLGLPGMTRKVKMSFPLGRYDITSKYN